MVCLLPRPPFSGRALREHRRSTDHPPLHPLRRILLPRFFFCEPSIQDREQDQRERGRGEEAADDDGRWTSAPIPCASVNGNRPTSVVIIVMTTGRSRRTQPLTIAWSICVPSLRN